MTDLEITRLCAAAMGYTNDYVYPDGLDLMFRNGTKYSPLHDDAQAMALVKKFGLIIFKPSSKWQVVIAEQWNKAGPGISIADPFDLCGESENLNRAICECVARIQLEKKAGSNPATRRSRSTKGGDA